MVYLFKNAITYIILNLIFVIKGNIIHNPVDTAFYSNPVYATILFESSPNTYIKISNLYNKYLEKEDIIAIKYQGNNYNYLPSLFLCKNQNNNYFLLLENNYYEVTLTSDLTLQSVNHISSLQSNIIYIGYIKEKKFDNYDTNKHYRCPIKENEIIIYGKSGNSIHFYYTLENEYYPVNFGDIGGHISCVFVESVIYICGVSIEQKIKIKVLVHRFVEKNIKGLDIVHTKDIDNFDHHKYPMLFDSKEEQYKFLCAFNINNNNIECIALSISITYTYLIKSYNIDAKTIYNFNKNFYYNSNCNFTRFYFEYLFCCGNTNINCNRRNIQLALINKFEIQLEASISNLTLKNNTDHVVISYVNNNANKLQEYYIYPPKCNNISISEEVMDKFTINAGELFSIKTNTKYYIKFENLPSIVKQIALNGKEINTENMINIESEESKIDFIFEIIKITDNIEIIYNISIEETYSSKCTIYLKFKSCYESCQECLLEESNINDHKCTKCKDTYFFLKDTKNCYTKEEAEAKINWYFKGTNADNSAGYFDYCNEKCRSCSGPSESDCLSCPLVKDNEITLSYFDSYQCLDGCPQQSFPKEKEVEGGFYYICQKCNNNCGTCEDKGNYPDMKCESCLDNNYIRYLSNCYKINNNEDKSYIDPRNEHYITSCFELHNLYIKEGGDECIELPGEEYYISNNKTGMLSPCDPNCLTCTSKKDDYSTNCISCRYDDYKFVQEGNCVKECSEGYYNNNVNNKCLKCHDNCLNCKSGPTMEFDSGELTSMECSECKEPNNMIKYNNNCFTIQTNTPSSITFNSNEIKNGKEYGTCYDFGKAIFYGNYECIDKPAHTYYVLNGEQNTGVINNCDQACDDCLGEKNGEDTNCLNCNENYFMTEDSNTNCIYVDDIPSNYIKNEDDKIYYKCHPNCSSCTEKYNSDNPDDMHCTECIIDYYFIKGTNNCYNMELLQNKEYYFKETEEKFYPCYNTCLKCLNNEPDENNHYCEICNSGLYFLENTNNCYDITFKENGYYLYENSVFRKCYENCKTCNNGYINGDMNCDTCQNEYYKLIGTNNCYNDLNQSFYLKDNFYYYCEENCLTCAGEKYPLENNKYTTISNNCLTCDNNKGLYLVEDLKNCENENYKGYYLDKTENILRPCYQSCESCRGPIENVNNPDEVNHNCIDCAESYSKLPNNLFPNNCYDERTISSWKFNEDSTLITYPSTINTEEAQYTTKYKEEYTTEYKEVYTTEYKEEYTTHYKEEYTTQYTTQNIIIDTTNEKLETKDTVKTNKNIESTELIETTQSINKEETTNLIITSTDVLKETYTTEKIEETPTPINMPDTTDYSNSEYTTNICYFTCNGCYGAYEINHETNEVINQNCIECNEGYKFIYGTKNCINAEYALNNRLYLNSTYDQYTQCDKACQSCNSGPEDYNTNCLQCNTEEGYYALDNDNTKCYNNNSQQIKNFYLDTNNIPYKWKQCYELCETCDSEGTPTNMNCLSCKQNIININTNNPYHYKLNSEKNCIEYCLDDEYITLSGDCVSSCPEGSYEFYKNKSCLLFCPDEYEVNTEKNKCILKKFDTTTSASEFKDQISNDITTYVNSSTVINGSNFIAVVMSSDDMDPEEQLKNGISAVDLGNCTEIIKEYYNISKNESLIILNIESKKDNNKNSDNDDNSFDLGKDTQLEIYDYSGTKLDISVCKEDIKIMKFIGDVAEELNIDTAKSLSEQGIDIFNPKDAFFSDICHQYDSGDGKDIIIDDRRTDIYKNASFCQDGCTYTGINYDLMSANCICDLKILQEDSINNNNNVTEETNVQNEKITFDSVTKSFLSNLFKFNFDVLKCSNLTFNLKIIVGNIGFYCLVIMFFLQIIFFIIYLIKKLKSLKTFMLVFNSNKNYANMLFYPPPKNKNNSKGNKIFDSNNSNNNSTKVSKKSNISEFKNKKNYKLNDIDTIFMVDESSGSNRNKFDNESELNLKKGMNKSNILNLNNNQQQPKNRKSIFFTNNITPIINIQTPIININNERQIKMMKQKDNLIFESERKKMKSKNTLKSSKFKPNNKFLSNKKSIHKMETNGEKKLYKNKSIKNKNSDRNKLSQTDYDLQDMDYEEAVLKDKRTYLRMYWAFLVDTQIILGTFCTENYLNLFVIKLSFFVCTFQISFFLNALFYTDDYISDAYHNDGVLNFVSGLPKSIYSFAATLITTNLLKMLSNSKSELMKVIREKWKDKDYIVIINAKLRKLRKKLIVYFILVFLLGIFFIYYVTSFCAVYRYSQKYWFIGCLESFAMDSGVALLICIFLALFRYISIKGHIKCFYLLANFISTFL